MVITGLTGILTGRTEDGLVLSRVDLDPDIGRNVGLDTDLDVNLDVDLDVDFDRIRF